MTLYPLFPLTRREVSEPGLQPWAPAIAQAADPSVVGADPGSLTSLSSLDRARQPTRDLPGGCPLPDQEVRPAFHPLHRHGRGRALSSWAFLCTSPSTGSVAGVVAEAGDVHPLEGVDGLAQGDRLARPAVVGSRRDADRHADVVIDAVARAQVDARVPGLAGGGLAARATRRCVADLAVERQAVRRLAVAAYGGGLRRAVAGGDR